MLTNTCSLLCCCCLLVLHLHSLHAHVSHFMDPTTGHFFPKYINTFPVRRANDLSREAVTTGRFEGMGGFPPSADQSGLSFEEFRKVLQCAPTEPSLYERIQFIKLVPYTRKSVKILAAWCEELCTPVSCVENLPRLERGEGSSELTQCLRNNRGRMLRIVNNTLYLDFPWKIDRFLEEGKVLVHRNMWEPISSILKMTSIPDAVWLHAEERTGFFGYEVPLPLFTSSPSFKSGDMAWPWDEHLKASTRMYTALRERGDFSDEAVRSYTGENLAPWEDRRAVAAFFGGITSLRSVIFHIANAHPGEVEAFFTGSVNSAEPWSVLSREETDAAYAYTNAHNGDNRPGAPRNTSAADGQPLYSGLREGLARNHLENGVQKYWLKYKYVLVLEGLNGQASADRLGWLLGHSGAVVLLQASFEFTYTFSARLVPYVHFVPVSVTGSDVVEKVRWLRANDHMARRIVENARNFAKSYLRLEDHYCYMAAALYEVAQISGEFDANAPFGPMIDVLKNLEI